MKQAKFNTSGCSLANFLNLNYILLMKIALLSYDFNPVIVAYSGVSHTLHIKPHVKCAFAKTQSDSGMNWLKWSRPHLLNSH